AVERYDVGLAILPLGHAWSSIRTIREAGDVIEAVGRKSMGIALDTFHMHLAGSRPEDVGHLRPRWIGLVRIADAPAGDPETLRDAHRLPPGDGVIPLADIVSRVRALGVGVTAGAACPLSGGTGEGGGGRGGRAEDARAALGPPARGSRR